MTKEKKNTSNEDKDLPAKLQKLENENNPEPSNPIVATGLTAIWVGGRKWQDKEKWKPSPTAETMQIKKECQGGVILTWIDPVIEAKAAVWTMQQIENFLENLSPFTSDVALVVLACLAEAPQAPMLEPVVIDADKIIKIKDPDARGINRDQMRLKIEQEMNAIQRIKFEIQHLPSPDIETGKWNTSGHSWKNDRLFDIVEIKEWQNTLFGEKEAVAVKWSVRAGQWAYYFLSPKTRRWVCNMSKALLQLSHRKDRRAEVLAKKIGQYVMLHKWKVGKGQTLSWSVGILCESIGEAPEFEEKPGRFRDVFETAVTLLKKIEIFSNVNYDWSSKTKKKNWLKEWLDQNIEFILPDLTITEVEKQMIEREHIKATSTSPLKSSKKQKEIAINSSTTPKKRGPTIKRPENFNAEELQKLRQKMGITQKELADQVGVSRRYLSDIENGKKPPSIKLAQRIEEWKKDVN